MTSKLLFQIAISESLIDELYEKPERYSAYKADCIRYYTETCFEELPDEQLLGMTIDDFRNAVYSKMNRPTW